jgi:hypothetical protein
MKGLTAAEKEYQIYTDVETLLPNPHMTGDKLHAFAIAHMKMDLDTDVSIGLKSQEYLDGVSDYIWNVNYRRNN